MIAMATKISIPELESELTDAKLLQCALLDHVQAVLDHIQHLPTDAAIKRVTKISAIVRSLDR